MPFLGVLDDKHLPRVPGTIVLDEHEARTEAITSGLKHGSGKSSHILLSPQPSDDINDPLNWPQAKKITCIVIIFWGASMYGGTVGPLLNSGLYVIAQEFHVSVADVVLLTGYQLLVVACSGPIVSALARKYGKRPCMLASCLFSLIGSIVGSTSKDITTLRAGRTIQGFGVAAYESLLFPVIGDLFFVHERGPYTAVANFVLAGVANLCGLVTGSITNSLGWKYLFHLLVALGGAQFLLQFLFAPETSYNRVMPPSKVQTLALGVHDTVEVDQEKFQHTGVVQVEDSSNAALRQAQQSIPKKSFWKNLALYNGKFSDENLIKLVLSPFAVCLNLVGLWFTLVPGIYICLYVAISFDLPQLFSIPPYNLSAEGIGLMSLGSFIGGALASVTLAVINDPLIRWATRKNNGIYEPEYRLLPMIFGFLIGAGMMGFGAASQNGASIYVVATTYGITLFGIMMALIPAAGYLLDAYGNLTHEITIINMTFKNLIIYAFSYFINDWTAAKGPATVFYTLGGVGFALMLFAPFLFVFGKKYRSYWYRNNLMEKLNIETHAEM